MAYTEDLARGTVDSENDKNNVLVIGGGDLLISTYLIR